MFGVNDGPLLRCLPALSLFLSCLSAVHGQGDDPSNLDNGQTFVSRPDIVIPTWNITVYEQDSLSPGYWFVSPYDNLNQSAGHGKAWTAPMIFDQHGDLVWSGAFLSQGYNIFDFRVSNVLGEDMLTFLWPQNHALVVLDQHFNTFKQLQISNPERESDNIHELNFVNDGKRALFFYGQTKNATKPQSETIGFNGTCLIQENTFRETDLAEDWHFVYRWSASKRVDLSESTSIEGSVEQRCNRTTEGWDWVQANSVDKFNEDGSYLMSARYTNTIYRILRSGDIAWRLGGNQSDFQADFTFARQHHARILSYDATRTTISFFDNGSAEDMQPESATRYSRGLIVTLDTSTDPKTATLVAEYKHPDGLGSLTPDQGSLQVLPDTNVLSNWVDGCHFSEHGADGKLLMEARLEQAWLRCSRSYKFAFVGRPSQAPDVRAETRNNGDGSLRTAVYVSWNGATEVSSWNLYTTNSEGRPEHERPAASVPRSGFETRIVLDGYADYVVAEALDKDGISLGRSAAGKTLTLSLSSDWTSEAEPQSPDSTSSQGEDQLEGSWKSTVASRSGFGGLLCAVAIVGALIFALRYWRRRRRESQPAGGKMRSSHEVMEIDYAGSIPNDEGSYGRRSEERLWEDGS